MIVVKGLPCSSVPILVEESGIIDVSLLLASGVPGNEGVKIPAIMLVKGIPCALVPVDVNENGTREVGTALDAPEADGVRLPWMTEVKGTPEGPIPVVVNEIATGLLRVDDPLTEADDDAGGLLLKPCTVVGLGVDSLLVLVGG